MKHDVVVVGSGAGGGPIALELTRAGLDVLVLEKGPRHTREAYSHETGIQPDGFIPTLEEEPHTVVTKTTTTPLLTNLGWIATCVGGGTVHMGGYFYRFHPDDFRMGSRFGFYEEIADWPYGYDELEPFYSKAEWEVGVSGQAGSNPFEGFRTQPYPLPPLDAHPIAGSLEGACRRRGLTPFPTPRSINSLRYRDRPACTYCTNCASYGCPVGARGSSQEALLAGAEATGRCEVRPRSMVHTITMNREGQATGCVYFDSEGKEQKARAKVICICASAVESARLLLMSTSACFPDGLANSNGCVGRYLQFHGVTKGHARIPAERLSDDLISSQPKLGRSVMDHYFIPEGVSDIAKGGLLRFGLAPQVPEVKPANTDGLTVYFEVFHDFIPNSGTFIELDSDVYDKWDLPVARIHLHRPRHHRLAGSFVMERAFEILEDLGAEDLTPTDLGGTSRYLVQGTCRAGDDPKTSVLNAWCQTHEISNLFVVDGSFMPTSGGAPPTLTIQANSFRVADHIVGRFRAGDFSK